MLMLALGFAARLAACEPLPSDQHDRMPIVSANGRYVVVPRYENEEVTATLFERAGEVAIARAQIPVDVWRDEVLVSNSGLIVLARQFGGPCHYGVEPTEPIVTVFSEEGASIGTVTAGELVTEHDFIELARQQVSFALQSDDKRETLTISVPVPPRNDVPAFAQLHVDVATATLLDAKRPLYPSPNIDVAPAVDVWRPEYEAPPAECAAAFARPDVQQLDADAFFARAIAKPLPDFPTALRLARVRGTVVVQAVVSESGNVLCTRHTAMPFAGGAAAGDGIRRWTFTPLEIDGQAVPFAGELVVRFDDGYDAPNP